MEDKQSQDREGCSVVEAPESRPTFCTGHFSQEYAGDQGNEEAPRKGEAEESEDVFEASPTLDHVMDQVAQSPRNSEPTHDDMRPLGEAPTQGAKPRGHTKKKACRRGEEDHPE